MFMTVTFFKTVPNGTLIPTYYTPFDQSPMGLYALVKGSAIWDLESVHAMKRDRC
ncbi:hypothetical protein J4Q44_G00175980 [Coregonus suidteri]|uniref:Uncharacterized protein n=1 Tax=Coregonus suidteri TaxID=861788 RepID=A0AAN8LLX8_9TELE